MARRIVIAIVIVACGWQGVTAQGYDYYFLEAMAQRQKGNITATFDLLNHCLEINPDGAEACYYIAQYYLMLKDRSQAQIYLKRASDLEPGNSTYTETLARSYAANGDFDASIEAFERIMASDRTRDDVLEILASLYEQNGDFANALSTIERLEELNGKNSATTLAKSSMYGLVGDRVAADSLRQLLLADVTTDAETRAYLLRQEIAQMIVRESPEDSIDAMLEKVLEVAPNDASARLQLVAHAYRRDDYGTVIRLCTSAFEHNPDEIAFYYYAGIAYIHNEDKDNALETFKRGTAVLDEHSNPEVAADFYSLLGHLYSDRGLMEEAFAAYDSCLQWKPDDVEALNNYAYFLSLEGRELTKAEQMSSRTVIAQPDNATYLDTYAWVLFMQGRYAEAKGYIERAIVCDSTSNAVITEHAGDIFAMSGDVEQAITYWQRALADDPDNKILQRKIKKKKYIK